MFGEKPIFGQSELTVDKKGRIFIPANTKRAASDKEAALFMPVIRFLSFNDTTDRSM